MSLRNSSEDEAKDYATALQHIDYAISQRFLRLYIRRLDNFSAIVWGTRVNWYRARPRVADRGTHSVWSLWAGGNKGKPEYHPRTESSQSCRHPGQVSLGLSGTSHPRLPGQVLLGRCSGVTSPLTPQTGLVRPVLWGHVTQVPIIQGTKSPPGAETSSPYLSGHFSLLFLIKKSYTLE